MRLKIIGLSHKDVAQGLHENKRITIAGKEYAAIYIPQKFVDHFNDPRPYQIWKGSRFSAKSWTKGIEFLYRADQDEYFRGIFTRNTQVAARNSQFQLFKDLIERYPELGEKFRVGESDMSIRHKKNKNFIRGASFEKADSLMSVPDATDIWLEEPITRSGSVNKKSFTTLHGNLRNSYGIPSRSHFTFNPISQDNFIYEDFFGEDKIFTEDKANIVTANYQDNPFCPLDRIEYLDDMKVSDYDRYQIDGLGLWGTIKTGQEYYSSFKTTFTVSTCMVNPDLPIHVGIDYNVMPYMTGKVYQIDPIKKIGDRLNIKLIREFAMAPPYNSVEETCKAILLEFESIVKQKGMFLYADASGKNRLPLKQVNSLQSELIKGFKGYVSDHNMRIPKSNPRHRDSPKGSLGRHSIMNKILNPLDNQFPINFKIDESCKKSIADLQGTLLGADGGKAKLRVTDNGVSYEKFGHMSDVDDYVICYIVNEYFV